MINLGQEVLGRILVAIIRRIAMKFNRKYSIEQKEQAINDCSTGMLITKAAKKHKIPMSTLAGWYAKIKTENPKPKAPVVNAYRMLEAENIKLKGMLFKLWLEGKIK
jgi:transposase-like protein